MRSTWIFSIYDEEKSSEHNECYSKYLSAFKENLIHGSRTETLLKPCNSLDWLLLCSSLRCLSILSLMQNNIHINIMNEGFNRPGAVGKSLVQHDCLGWIIIANRPYSVSTWGKKIPFALAINLWAHMQRLLHIVSMPQTTFLLWPI